MAVKKGARTANRILDAAETIFAQRGYAAASLREIANEASVTQPALYNHFDSKENLYRAVLERGLRPSLNMMKSQLAQSLPREAMIALPEQAIDLLADHPPIAAFLIQAAHSDEDEAGKIALAWLEQLLMISRDLNEAASAKMNVIDILLRQVALFHICCGYFWSAPLIARYIGRDIREEDMIKAQKRLTSSIMNSLFPE